MGGQPLIFFALAGALLLVVLILVVAADHKRSYPIAALAASVVCAGYIALEATTAYVSWFFIGFAVVSPPISLLVYAARWFATRRGQRSGT
jgi:hypothetical protein